MSLISPFNLERILVVDVAGTPEIFSFIAVLFISIVMGKYNFSNKIALSLFGLFGVIMAAWLQNLYVLIILATGLTVFYSISKMGGN